VLADVWNLGCVGFEQFHRHDGLTVSCCLGDDKRVRIATTLK
jgi:hypothetical protein